MQRPKNSNIVLLAASAAMLALLPLGHIGVRGQSGLLVYTTWRQPGGSIEGAQYSALKQINKSNVSRLELKWFYPAPGPIGRFAFSPLVVDDVMYVVGKDSAVFALDAVTGKEIWKYETEGTPTNRGFNYWENTDRSDRRIIFAAGSNNYRVHRNGPVVTAGGLIFIAHFADRTVRAFDKDNGTILWEKKLEPNFAGIPAVYEVNGKQYVAFYGSDFEKPGENNVAWEGGAPGSQGYYVFSLANEK